MDHFRVQSTFSLLSTGSNLQKPGAVQDEHPSSHLPSLLAVTMQAKPVSTDHLELTDAMPEPELPVVEEAAKLAETFVQDKGLKTLPSAKDGNHVASDVFPSADFKRLIDSIVAVHTQELCKMQAELVQVRNANEALKLRGNRMGSMDSFADSEDAVGVTLSAPSSHPCEMLPNRRRPRRRLRGADFVEKVLKELEDDCTTLNEGASADSLFAYAGDTPQGNYDRADSMDACQVSVTCCQRAKIFLQSNMFEGAIVSLLFAYVLFMAFELQYIGYETGYVLGIHDATVISEGSFPQIRRLFFVGDKAFTAVFILDVLVRISFLRWEFWKSAMNWLDLAVTAASVVELLPVDAVDLNVLRLVRVGKVARSLRMVTITTSLHSLQLLIKCLWASFDMLFWSFCLLTVIQCVAGIVVSLLAQSYMQDEQVDPEARRQVFRYYGTFTRTFLTMFEILFANWAPACRILVETNESFSLFFLIYRCVIGFAVLNVVNAVFVQQTLKTASSDEELQFRQKQIEVDKYTRKVRQFFKTIDESGDGAITFDEFSQLVESPKLKFWVSQLELEYHDLLSLFEMMDDGDGEITLDEFIEGAARLKGSAKSIDIWRLETKLEVLLSAILKKTSQQGDETVSLEGLLQEAGVKQIHSTAFGRKPTVKTDMSFAERTESL
eukprot:TRINITY_DN102344_c0_g1_i1.p1 TRINITY_DN102344_c0_g1~~TRINITY_DN102344_c0_g1_i1.p1  ORF type:complete len:677 (-),score=119.31 TRINITY_DN102344_c0_g1_i1:514-2511(-)